MGDRFLSRAGAGKNYALPMKVGGKLQPSTGKRSCTHGSRNFSQYGAGSLGKGS